ncbi:MAG: hypothetical protein GY870_05140 [archaeon]|nr:hypothetical protein [archaeon]
MRKRITQFLLDDFQRGYLFKKMCKKIGEQLNTSAGIIWKYGENAINYWESIEKQKIDTIIIMDPEEQDIQIKKILDFFQENLSSIEQKDDISFGNSFDLASRTLYSIFKNQETSSDMNLIK